jgi:dihydrolipoamide dehydrogenase
MQGADRDLVKVWEKKNAHRFDAVMLNTRVTGAEATPDGLKVSFEGAKAPAARRPTTVCWSQSAARRTAAR